MENGNNSDRFDAYDNRPDGRESAAPMKGKKECRDELRLMRGFMDDEYSDCLYYKRLSAKMCCPENKRLFACMSKDESRHLRKLQTAYFLRTGDTYAPECCRQHIPSILMALHERYKEETKGAEAYRRAAKETDDKALRCMYLELAGDEARHACEIERLTEELMC